MINTADFNPDLKNPDTLEGLDLPQSSDALPAWEGRTIQSQNLKRFYSYTDLSAVFKRFKDQVTEFGGKQTLSLGSKIEGFAIPLGKGIVDGVQLTRQRIVKKIEESTTTQLYCLAGIVGVAVIAALATSFLPLNRSSSILCLPPENLEGTQSLAFCKLYQGSKENQELLDVLKAREAGILLKFKELEKELAESEAQKQEELAKLKSQIGHLTSEKGGTLGFKDPKVLERIKEWLVQPNVNFSEKVLDLVNDLAKDPLSGSDAIKVVEDAILLHCHHLDPSLQSKALDVLFSLYGRENYKIDTKLELQNLFSDLSKFKQDNQLKLNSLIRESKLAADQLKAFMLVVNGKVGSGMVYEFFFDNLLQILVYKEGGLQSALALVDTVSESSVWRGLKILDKTLGYFGHVRQLDDETKEQIFRIIEKVPGDKIKEWSGEYHLIRQHLERLIVDPEGSKHLRATHALLEKIPASFEPEKTNSVQLNSLNEVLRGFEKLEDSKSHSLLINIIDQLAPLTIEDKYNEFHETRKHLERLKASSIELKICESFLDRLITLIENKDLDFLKKCQSFESMIDGFKKLDGTTKKSIQKAMQKLSIQLSQEETIDPTKESAFTAIEKKFIELQATEGFLEIAETFLRSKNKKLSQRAFVSMSELTSPKKEQKDTIATYAKAFIEDENLDPKALYELLPAIASIGKKLDVEVLPSSETITRVVENWNQEECQTFHTYLSEVKSQDKDVQLEQFAKRLLNKKTYSWIPFRAPYISLDDNEKHVLALKIYKSLESRQPLKSDDALEIAATLLQSNEKERREFAIQLINRLALEGKTLINKQKGSTSPVKDSISSMLKTIIEDPEVDPKELEQLESTVKDLEIKIAVPSETMRSFVENRSKKDCQLLYSYIKALPACEEFRNQLKEFMKLLDAKQTPSWIPFRAPYISEEDRQKRGLATIIREFLNSHSQKKRE